MNQSGRTNRRDLPLQVESLEGLTLLSGVAAGVLAESAEVMTTATAARTLAFNATARGTFSTSRSNPDTGTNYHIVATGSTANGTKFAVGGVLQTPGFIAQGRTTGTLTVYTADGTLTLSVTGPLQKGFSPLPPQVGFTITGGTGVYANNHNGTGRINLVEHAVTTSTGTIGQSGTISLVFRSGPPIA